MANDVSPGAFNPGTELDYVQRTSNLAFTTETDAIVGNPVVYDGNTRVKIEFMAGGVDTTTGAITRVYDGATALNRTIDQRQSGSDISIYFAFFFTPSAGAHTFKVTIATISGSGNVNAGAVGGGTSTYAPMYMRITVA